MPDARFTLVRTTYVYALKAGNVIDFHGAPLTLLGDVEIETTSDLSPYADRPALTEADAAADLAGTPRPDNPSA